VDLRTANMKLWRKRFRALSDGIRSIPPEETSSRVLNSREYWKDLDEIEPGKICGWLFSGEEKGKRMKA
jgi:hypothetical protein